jgi:peptide deformylase
MKISMALILGSLRLSRGFFLDAARMQHRPFASTPTLLEEEVDPGEVSGLTILKWPHPALRAPNAEVEAFDDDLRALSRRMFDLMYKAAGVGLAAPQVGINKRMIVWNECGDAKKWLTEAVLVNPKITDRSDKTEADQEGCLSFPGVPPDSERLVSRHTWIKVEAFNLKGKPFKKKYEGFEAKIFQHEYDHLEGKMYIDHLSPEHSAEIQPRLDQLLAEHGPGGAL